MAKHLDKEMLCALSKEYGDGFYLLDSDVFEANYKSLTEAFSAYYPKFNIAYSYKTNYTPKLVQIVDRLGGYAEVVSEMEMQIALSSGVAPERIIWNGPVKNAEKAEWLLANGGTVNLDSASEFDMVRKTAAANPDKILRVGIRCNYDVNDGVISRFGFDTNSREFDEALELVASIPNAELVNLQAHFAKRAPEYWTARAEGMLAAYDKAVKEYGLKPERLDLGGGIFGNMPDSLRTQLNLPVVTFDDYAVRAAKLFADHFGDDPDAPWLFVEPGTALAGDCMRFVSRIETIKTVRGKTIVTAFGSQKNISMNGINPPMELIGAGNGQTMLQDADIVGYTCIEGDVLYKNYSGPLAVGDFLVLGNCGSYSLVMKPPFILPNFAVIDISNGEAQLIKSAETFEDLFHTFAF